MASFGKISNWWYGLAKHFKNVHCSISVNIYDLAQAMGYQEDLKNTQAHWEEHVYNVKQSRQFAADNGVKAFGSSTMKKGDTFVCHQLILGKELVMSDFRQESKIYVVGREHGITTLNLC